MPLSLASTDAPVDVVLDATTAGVRVSVLQRGSRPKLRSPSSRSCAALAAGRVNGSGLGLAIARGLAEANAAGPPRPRRRRQRLHADTAPGRGCRANNQPARSILVVEWTSGRSGAGAGLASGQHCKKRLGGADRRRARPARPRDPRSDAAGTADCAGRGAASFATGCGRPSSSSRRRVTSRTRSCALDAGADDPRPNPLPGNRRAARRAGGRCSARGSAPAPATACWRWAICD